MTNATCILYLKMWVLYTDNMHRNCHRGGPKFFAIFLYGSPRQGVAEVSATPSGAVRIPHLPPRRTHPYHYPPSSTSPPPHSGIATHTDPLARRPFLCRSISSPTVTHWRVTTSPSTSTQHHQTHRPTRTSPSASPLSHQHYHRFIVSSRTPQSQ